MELRGNEQSRIKIVEGLPETRRDAMKLLKKAMGDKRKAEEIITTSFVESAMNQVVSGCFVKAQNVRWSQQGAHLLLHVRSEGFNRKIARSVTTLVPRHGG